jgi:hypothetical protein
MTEHNIFCYSKKYNDENSFQQERYRAFNKPVGEDRYYEILEQVRSILSSNNKLSFKEFWKSVTQDQWQQLLSIPEAKDFKEGFEYISGQTILNDKVKIIVEGKEIYISRDSAKTLNLV